MVMFVRPGVWCILIPLPTRTPVYIVKTGLPIITVVMVAGWQGQVQRLLQIILLWTGKNERHNMSFHQFNECWRDGIQWGRIADNIFMQWFIYNTEN